MIFYITCITIVDMSCTYLFDFIKTFDGIERGNFLDDAFALAKAGYLPVSFALNLTRYMHKEDQYLPFYTVFSIHLPLFETILTGTPGYEYYRV